LGFVDHPEANIDELKITPNDGANDTIPVLGVVYVVPLSFPNPSDPFIQ